VITFFTYDLNQIYLDTAQTLEFVTLQILAGGTMMIRKGKEVPAAQDWLQRRRNQLITSCYELGES
jgi:hypothetical protein